MDVSYSETGPDKPQKRRKVRLRHGDDTGDPDDESTLEASPGSRPGPGRKPKACLECKKLKMRCEVLPGDHKCRHCLRRKVECIIKHTYMAPNDPGQSGDKIMVYEGKIDAMREEIMQMRQSLDAVLGKSNTQHRKDEPRETETSVPPRFQQSENVPNSPKPLSARPSPAREPSGRANAGLVAMPREYSSDTIAEDDDQQYGPEALEEPMGSLYEVTRLRNIRNNQSNTPPLSTTKRSRLDDFITRGVISEQKAEELYDIFHKTLNHYLWVGLEQIHTSWISVRESSELLAATILTVTALHMPEPAHIFDACYNEFLSLVSTSMFLRYHSVDDVRALCIAAFWLSEHSWKLTGHAIRIATELGIHQSFIRALEGDREHFLRARLWYMLYVCDRHFSIAYGRPPTVAESAQIRECELFLASPFSSMLDTRILSQVSLMQILTHVYGRFSERPLPTMEHVRAAGYGALAAGDGGVRAPTFATMLSESDFDKLRAFNLEVDHWRMRWYPRQAPSPFVGQFTNKGVILYAYFAKLQINSLAIRGVSVGSTQLSTERKEFANMAISAASGILTLVQEEDDLRRALVGTPLYVHTMIAFASVFLMKVATKWDGIMGLNIEFENVARLLGNMVAVLRGAVTSDRHMLKHIAQGLEKMLGRMKAERKEGMMRCGTANGGAGRRGAPVESNNQGDQGDEDAGTALQGVDDTRLGLADWAPDYTAPDTRSFEDDLAGIDETFMYETFGTGSAGDVYNMLSSQFLN